MTPTPEHGWSMWQCKCVCIGECMLSAKGPHKAGPTRCCFCSEHVEWELVEEGE